MVIFLKARGTDWSTIPVLCLRFSDWPISIHNWVYIFHRVLSNPDSDVLCSEEYQTKKLFVCCKMFAFFKAIFKFCTAKKNIRQYFIEVIITDYAILIMPY